MFLKQSSEYCLPKSNADKFSSKTLIIVFYIPYGYLIYTMIYNMYQIVICILISHPEDPKKIMNFGDQIFQAARVELLAGQGNV